jgi:hypothetical protein
VEWIRLQTEGSGRDKGLKERKEGRKNEKPRRKVEPKI